MTTRNVYDRATEFCDELERKGVALGLDGRQAIRDLAHEIILDVAEVAQPFCGASREILRRMLCRAGEKFCDDCNGTGCPRCRYCGVREAGVQP